MIYANDQLGKMLVGNRRNPIILLIFTSFREIQQLINENPAQLKILPQLIVYAKYHKIQTHMLGSCRLTTPIMVLK